MFVAMMSSAQKSKLSREKPEQWQRTAGQECRRTGARRSGERGQKIQRKIERTAQISEQKNTATEERRDKQEIEVSIRRA